MGTFALGPVLAIEMLSIHGPEPIGIDRLHPISRPWGDAQSRQRYGHRVVTVDEYLAAAPEPQRTTLGELRRLLALILPDGDRTQVPR